MHSSCPTSCPGHLSQTLTVNPTEEEFDGSSELKVSSVIINLLNKAKKKISLSFQCDTLGKEIHLETWAVSGEERENWRIRRLSARRRTEKPASRPPFILSLPLLFRFGFYPAVNVCARSFRAAGMYYDPNKRSRRIVYELLASPKATKAYIFIENSTFISAAFDYRSKDNNNHLKKKKGRFSRTIPEGFNPPPRAHSEQLKRSLYCFPFKTNVKWAFRE